MSLGGTLRDENIVIPQRTRLYSPRRPFAFRLLDLVLLCRGFAFCQELFRHLYAIQHSVLSRMYGFWKTVYAVSCHGGEDIKTFRTCWIDLLVDEQLEKRLGDVKPKPDGFPLPWEVLEVDLIYDAPITM